MKLVYLFTLMMLITSQFLWANQKFPTPTMRSHATLSPNGAKIIYHGRGDKLQSTLFIADANGENEELFFGGASSIEQEARWSPDGDWIAFVSGDSYESGGLQLNIVNSKGKQHRVLTNVKHGVVKGPSWSPDSEKILFEIRQSKLSISTLHAVNVKDGKQIQLTTEHDGMYVQAEWSPDGNAILAVERNKKDQGVSDLWIFAIGHVEHRRRITNTPDGEAMPVWGINGKYVIYSRPAESQNQNDLFAFHFDNNKEYRLTETDNTSEFFPIVSPDGQFILYDSFEKVGDKWVSTIEWQSLPIFDN